MCGLFTINQIFLLLCFRISNSTWIVKESHKSYRFVQFSKSEGLGCRQPIIMLDCVQAPSKPVQFESGNILKYLSKD